MEKNAFYSFLIYEVLYVYTAKHCNFPFIQLTMIFLVLPHQWYMMVPLIVKVFLRPMESLQAKLLPSWHPIPTSLMLVGNSLYLTSLRTVSPYRYHHPLMRLSQ